MYTLGVITYDSEVRSLKEAGSPTGGTCQSDQPIVPVVSVSLVKTMNLLPHRSITVPILIEGESESPQLLE